MCFCVIIFIRSFYFLKPLNSVEMSDTKITDLAKQQFGNTVEFIFHVRERFTMSPLNIQNKHEYGNYLERADLKKVGELLTLETNFYSVRSFFMILHDIKYNDRYGSEVCIFLVKKEDTGFAFFVKKIDKSNRVVEVFYLKRSIKEFLKINKALFFIKNFKK